MVRHKQNKTSHLQFIVELKSSENYCTYVKTISTCLEKLLGNNRGIPDEI